MKYKLVQRVWNMNVIKVTITLWVGQMNLHINLINLIHAKTLMASVTQKIPNYVLGISTQPDEKKLPGQVVDLVNGVPDVVEQLIKRPGSHLISAISPSTAAANTKWFNIYTR